MDFNIYDDEFIYDGYQYFGMGGWLTALPLDVPEELKKNIGAGLITTSGYSSLDYVKRKYLKNFKLENNEKPENFLILQDINKCIKSYYKKSLERQYSIQEQLPDSFGIYVATAALKRLESSFKLARFSMMEGFRFETMCIIKLILEQSTWAYAVHNLPDNKVNDIQPSRTINNFKKINPHIGKFYGSINDVSHVSTKAIRQIVSLGKEGSSVRLKDYNWTLFSGLDLIRATDVYCMAAELILKDYLEEFNFIIGQENTMPLPDRAIVKNYEDLRNRVVKYYEGNSENFE